MNYTYFKKVKKYLPEIYKNYLKKYVDEKQIREMFSDREVASAFANVITVFYKDGNYGKKNDDEIRQALKDYEITLKKQTGFSDYYLKNFLHMYRYYTECMVGEIVDRFNNYNDKKEKEYFNNISYVTCEATENLFNDLQNGNRWWEYDSATTLRAQFMNDKIVIPEYILQRLCKKYLGRDVDLKKELHLNENRSTPPMEIVKELDTKMEKVGLRLVYAYVGEINGEPAMIESIQKPQDGRYYLRRYVPDRTKTAQK